MCHGVMEQRLFCSLIEDILMYEERKQIWKKLILGMCYYPEQWPKALWQDDLRRMKTCGVSVIRIAEFCWALFEPEEGTYDFSLFDSFLDLAEKEEMQVLFCTPTAAPPAWLTEKYPEVLNARIDGVKYRHGMRRHYTYNSPVYQRLCANIVEQTAAHFAHRSCIVGWQIDNEINCAMNEFYSESDTQAFRQFLKEKYETLDALNEAWGNVFWSQNYSDWSQVHLPRVTVYGTTNPHLQMDYIRFISDSAIRFCGFQAEILRRFIKPGDFITTNGLFDNLDSHQMTQKHLDVFCYDSYPNFAYAVVNGNKSDLKDRKWSRNLMKVRSVNPHFGITEQQAGACGWVNSVQNPAPKSPAPQPGQMMLWAMQSIMHGADFVEFFRWRTSVMGTEIYWQGILDWDNLDNRKTEELKQISLRMKQAADLAGASYEARVALVQDYDNLWDAQIDVWHGQMADESEKAIFTCAQLTHTPLDIINLSQETSLETLSRYKLLFYPHPLILKERTAELLHRYVANGGILIIGARCGMKDETGKCIMAPIPGLLAADTQTYVADSTLTGAQRPASLMDWDGRLIETGSFNEILAVKDNPDGPREAQILAEYTGGYYSEKPALCETIVGSGKILHFGGVFTRNNVEAFLDYAGEKDPLRCYITAPEVCETALRVKDGIRFLFVLNYSDQKQEIFLNREMTDIDTGKAMCGTVMLAAFETRIYRL